MRLLALIFALIVAPLICAAQGTTAPGLPPYQGMLLSMIYPPNGVLAVGTPISCTITSTQLVSTTDQTPVTQYTNGITMDCLFSGLTVSPVLGGINGGTSNYPNFKTGATSFPFTKGAPPQPISFTVTSPGYNSSGVLGTVTRTVFASYPLVQASSTQGTNSATEAQLITEQTPVQAQSGSNAIVSFALSDPIFAGDTFPGNAIVLSGIFIDTAGHATLSSVSVPVTNNSTLSYASIRPICNWDTPEGTRVGSASGVNPSITLRMHCRHFFGMSGNPVAAVEFVEAGAGATTQTQFGTLGTSTLIAQTQCTGTTNGSNAFTSCGPTDGFVAPRAATTTVGLDSARVSVLGVAGEPKMLDHTSPTSMDLGVNTLVTTNAVGPVISVASSNLVAGEGLCDGCIGGNSLLTANVNLGAALAFTAGPVQADITYTSNRPTLVNLCTSGSTVFSCGTPVNGTNVAGVIQHDWLGTTSATATVYDGGPYDTYEATVTGATLNGAGLTDGWLPNGAEAIVYPNVGDATGVLDTATGADGTGKDWNGQTFAANGTSISPNLENLSVFLDFGENYAPAYAWVQSGGTCVTSACVTSTGAEPAAGAGNFFANVSTALTAIKAYNQTGARTTTHADAYGGVVAYYVGTAGTPVTYNTGWGASINTAALFPTTNGAPVIITSALHGAAATTTGVNTDPLDVIWTNPSSYAVPQNTPTRIQYINIQASNDGIVGSDTLVNNAFPTSDVVFIGDVFKPTATAFVIYKVGVYTIINSVDDEGAFKGSIVSAAAGFTSAVKLIAGSTIICGGYSANALTPIFAFNLHGVVSYNCAPDAANGPDASPFGSQFAPQPLSMSYSGVRLMNAYGSFTLAGLSGINNVSVDDVLMEFNGPSNTVAFKLCDDTTNAPCRNALVDHVAVHGQRADNSYLAGVPDSNTSAKTTGGALAANHWFPQIDYSTAVSPTVESSTDGMSSAVNLTAGTSVNSWTYNLPNTGTYLAWIYGVNNGASGTSPAGTCANSAGNARCGAAALGAADLMAIGEGTAASTSANVICIQSSGWLGETLGASTNLINATVYNTGSGKLGTITGLSSGACTGGFTFPYGSASTFGSGTFMFLATGIQMGQQVLVVDAGPQQDPLAECGQFPLSGCGAAVPGANYLKTFASLHQNIWGAYSSKGMRYVYGAGQQASAGRIGDFFEEFNVSSFGNVYTNGAATLYGEFVPPLTYFGSTTTSTLPNVYTLVQDNSFGTGTGGGVNPIAPGTALGEMDACPIAPLTNINGHGLSTTSERIPYDIQGSAWPNQTTDAAGAYNPGTCQ
jgi:hypothetical protein